MNWQFLNKRLSNILLCIVLLSFASEPLMPSVNAQNSRLVTLTIWRVVEHENLDSGQPGESGRGDYCAAVGFLGGGGGDEYPCPRSLLPLVKDPRVVEGKEPNGLMINNSWTIEPFWEYVHEFPAQRSPPFTIEIVLTELDINGGDKLEINPVTFDRVILSLDLPNNSWSSPGVFQSPSCAKSQGRTGEIYFDLRFGTDTGDSDGDGLLDSWELYGFDDDCDGIIDVDLPSFGAEADHKDLFLELDWMKGLRPLKSDLFRLQDAFAAAPIDAGTKASDLTSNNPVPGKNAKNNPDGKEGINLWIAAGESIRPDGTVEAYMDNIPGGDEVDLQLNLSGLTQPFYDIKNQKFDPSRRLIFRYALSSAEATNNIGVSTGPNPTSTPRFLVDQNQSWFDDEWKGHRLTITAGTGAGQTREISSNTAKVLIVKTDWDIVPDNTSAYKIDLFAGKGELGGNDLIVFGGSLSSSGLTILPNARLIMHEFGHTLNLHHGGDEVHNCKPNYVSIMNYDYPFGIPQRIPPATTPFFYIIDFSPPRFPGGRGAAPLAVLNEMKLDETSPLDQTDTFNMFKFRQYFRKGTEGGPVDFGCSNGVDDNGNVLFDRDDPACYKKVETPLNEPVDWDGDGKTDNTNVTANIDLPGNKNVELPLSTLELSPIYCDDNSALTEFDGFNDWLHISLPFRQFGDSSSDPVNPVLEPEPTLEEIFAADVVPPTVTVFADPSILWPPNGKLVLILVTGQVSDLESTLDLDSASYSVSDEYGQVQPGGPVAMNDDGSYSFITLLEARRNGRDRDGRHYTITVQVRDLAGNPGSASTEVIVPHEH